MPSISRPDLVIYLALLLLTLSAYWSVGSFEFVHYDDGEYVSENSHVHAGLTAQNIAWAFRTRFFDNWHPLTWLSYMFDSQLFGIKPGAFHLVNLALHCINNCLLFGLFKKLTGERWRSAFVAALFAIHPLHVESVAWISERKDVLSGVFFLLTLLAYVCYTERPKPGRYLLALLFFAFGLMAKPMLVTLPFVLLLLDWWPLGRWTGRPASQNRAGSGQEALSPARLVPAPTSWRSSIFALAWEKAPFFALALASCIITYFAQAEALVPSSYRPLPARIANVLVSYRRYLGKTFWPHGLAAYYPYPPQWPAWEIAGSALLLLVVTVIAFRQRRQRPFLAVGWFWFLGMLVPVIGLIQVGGQSMADRYMYLPMIGLLLMIAWGAPALSVLSPRLCWGLSVASILAGLIVSSLQVANWKDSITLFEHALAVTSESTLAHDNLAAALTARGRTNEALEHLSAALKIDPGDFWAYGNRGAILLGQGKTDEAIATFKQALQLNPNRPELNHNLGISLSEQKRFSEAVPYFSAALRDRPDYANAYLALGNALVALGKLDEATANYAACLRINPSSAAGQFNLGHALNEQGRFNEAAPHFVETLRLQPTNADAHCNLAVALFRQGKALDASLHFNEALGINPRKAEIHFQYASFLFAQNKPTEAVPQYREAVRLEPGFIPALNDLAFLLAAHPDPKIRNGPEAVTLAERACELTGHKESFLMGTLAAAYAETGQFPKAVEAAQKAFDLAQSSGQKELAASNQKLLQLYREGKPYRLDTN